MGVPQDKATGYTVVTFVAAIVLYIVAAALVTATTGAFGLARPVRWQRARRRPSTWASSAP